MSRRSFWSYIKEQKVSSRFWNELKSAIATRLVKPFSYPQFVIYFLTIIVMVGLTGVFASIASELGKCVFNHRNVTLSLATFFVALLASGSADLILSTEDESDRSMKIVGVSSLLLGIALFWLTFEFPEKWSYAPAGLGTLLAFAMWWLANSKNPTLMSPPIDPINAAPASPDTLAGNTDEFNL